MRALSLAELFQTAVSTQKLAGYKLELAAPDGPSTGGGVQSTQPILLISESGGHTLVMGTADQKKGTAELRTHAYLARMASERFKGAPFVVDRAQYEALVNRLKAFLGGQGLTVNVADYRPTAPVAQPPSAAGSKSTMYAVAGAIAVALIIALALIVMR
jgi:hypothetical protein